MEWWSENSKGRATITYANWHDPDLLAAMITCCSKRFPNLLRCGKIHRALGTTTHFDRLAEVYMNAGGFIMHLDCYERFFDMTIAERSVLHRNLCKRAVIEWFGIRVPHPDVKIAENEAKRIKTQ